MIFGHHYENSSLLIKNYLVVTLGHPKQERSQSPVIYLAKHTYSVHTLFFDNSGTDS